MLLVRIFSGGCRGRVAAKVLVSKKNCSEVHETLVDLFCSVLHFGNLQKSLRKECGYQIRSEITTSAFRTASGVAAPTVKAAENLHQAEPREQEVAELTQESPVCAYNEWDPLEVLLNLSPHATQASIYSVGPINRVYRLSLIHI